MSEQLIYAGMVEIMRRIVQIQTNAEQLMKPAASEEDMLKMLQDIEVSAAWLREKLSMKLTEEERAAYTNARPKWLSGQL